jgi:hypothetical protein
MPAQTGPSQTWPCLCMQLSASDEAIPRRSTAKMSFSPPERLLLDAGCMTPKARETLRAEQLMASMAPEMRGSDGTEGLPADEHPASKQIATPARATLTAGA